MRAVHQQRNDDAAAKRGKSGNSPPNKCRNIDQRPNIRTSYDRKNNRFAYDAKTAKRERGLFRRYALRNVGCISLELLPFSHSNLPSSQVLQMHTTVRTTSFRIRQIIKQQIKFEGLGRTRFETHGLGAQQAAVERRLRTADLQTNARHNTIDVVCPGDEWSACESKTEHSIAW